MDKNELCVTLLELLNFQICCLRKHLETVYLPFEIIEGDTKLIIRYEEAKKAIEEYLPFRLEDE